MAGRKICNILTPAINATPEADRRKYFNKTQILYWEPGPIAQLVIKWFGGQYLFDTHPNLHTYIKAERVGDQRFV